jgi:hypothetical protein
MAFLLVDDDPNAVGKLAPMKRPDPSTPPLRDCDATRPLQGRLRRGLRELIEPGAGTARAE